MIPKVALLAVLLALGPVGAGPSTAHYVPHVGDSFSFSEVIAVRGGFGNYSGYTETTTVTGTVNVTAVLANGTETASYAYSVHFTNSTGADLSWPEKGTFTFSATTFRFVTGTDNESAFSGSQVWFYMNDSLPVGSTWAPLDTPMTVCSLDTSYALDTGAGANVETIYADGNGTYVRDDSYGVFNATYNERAYFDPSTGYVVAIDYTELDADGRGDGFVYTDLLAVSTTKGYAFTAASPPQGYPVTFTETGLPAGKAWTVTFDGVPTSGTGSSQTFSGIANATYLFGANATGYTASPGVGLVTVSGVGRTVTVSFVASSSSSSPNDALLVGVVVAVIVVIVLVLIALALAARSRRARGLPRHSAGGQVRYGPPPGGPAPPPISLAPSDQPRIQQVVVKEVVKVNCRYCGSLIDSTAEKCPFCGATRS